MRPEILYRHIAKNKKMKKIMPGRTDDKAKQSFSKGHRESADDVRREGTER